MTTAAASAPGRSGRALPTSRALRLPRPELLGHRRRERREIGPHATCELAEVRAHALGERRQVSAYPLRELIESSEPSLLVAARRPRRFLDALGESAPALGE